jgi:ribonuclease R
MEVNMKEQILEILNKTKQPLNETKILEKLKLRTSDELKEVCDTLREMEQNGEVYRTKNGGYTLFKYTHFKVGRLSVNKKGFGFVLLENEPDIHIDESNINGAIHNDLVAVEKVNKEEGRVIKVIDRSLTELVGEFAIDSFGKGMLLIDNDKVKLDIVIEEEDRNNAMPGHKVLVSPYKQIRENKYQGKVLKVLGHKDDPGVDILSIVYEHNIHDVFPEDVMKEADELPLEIDPKDMEGRKD